MIELPAESDVLAGHPVEGCGSVPSFEGVAGILREVRRAGSGGGSIDGREQNQIAPGIIDAAAAERQPVAVAVEPEAVVDHVAEEALLRPLRRAAMTTDAAAVLATD